MDLKKLTETLVTALGTALSKMASPDVVKEVALEAQGKAEAVLDQIAETGTVAPAATAELQGALAELDGYAAPAPEAPPATEPAEKDLTGEQLAAMVATEVEKAAAEPVRKGHARLLSLQKALVATLKKSSFEQGTVAFPMPPALQGEPTPTAETTVDAQATAQASLQGGVSPSMPPADSSAQASAEAAVAKAVAGIKTAPVRSPWADDMNRERQATSRR